MLTQDALQRESAQRGWEYLVDGEESAGPVTIYKPAREELFAVYDRIVSKLPPLSEFSPATVDADRLHGWIWVNAATPAEVALMRHVLNRLLSQAVKTGLRRTPLRLGAKRPPVTPLLH